MSMIVIANSHKRQPFKSAQVLAQVLSDSVSDALHGVAPGLSVKQRFCGVGSWGEGVRVLQLRDPGFPGASGCRIRSFQDSSGFSFSVQEAPRHYPRFCLLFLQLSCLSQSSHCLHVCSTIASVII